MTTLAFLAILVLTLRVGADGPTNSVDISTVLTRAAGDFATSVGSSLATGALKNGVCLARSDDTTNKDKCVNQPAGFVFVSYDQPSVGPGKTTQPMKLTSSTSAIVKCTKSNALQHCANQASTTQSNQVTTSNTVGFTATTTLTLTVDEKILGAGLGASVSQGFSKDTSDTTGKAQTIGTSATAINGLDVPVGQCGAVNVTAYSFESAAEFPYTVSMHGGVSIWLSDKTAIPSIQDNGAHYNWLVPVTTLVQIAKKNGYGNNLDTNGDTATFHGLVTSVADLYNSTAIAYIADCNSFTPIASVTPPTPQTPNPVTLPASGTPAAPTAPGAPTPSATHPAIATGRASPGSTYTVVSGDTLTKIASTHGTTTAAILAANPSITNPDLITPGQVIKLSAGGTPAGTSSSGSNYSVVAGDTLTKVASTHGTTVAAILAANPSITNPDLITPGQVIKLPASG